MPRKIQAETEKKNEAHLKRIAKLPVDEKASAEWYRNQEQKQEKPK